MPEITVSGSVQVIEVAENEYTVEVTSPGVQVVTVGEQGPPGPQGPPGTTDHAALSNLSFADSGHTGFAGLDVSNVFIPEQTFQNGITIQEFPSAVDDATLTYSILADRLVSDTSVQAPQFIGGGVSLTNLNASNVSSGTLADARLSGNIARLDVANDWTAPQSHINVNTQWLNAGGSVTHTTVGPNITTTAATTTSVPLIVSGKSAQTANLTEWLNSSSDVLVSVGPTGAVTSGTITVRQSGGTPGTDEVQISHNGTNAVIESKDGSVSLRPSAGAGGGLQVVWTDAMFLQRTGSAVYLLDNARVCPLASQHGWFANPSTGDWQSSNSAWGLAAAKATLTNVTASVVPLTVKAAASQTANVQEWQNSAGVVMASMTVGNVANRLKLVNHQDTNKYIDFNINATTGWDINSIGGSFRFYADNGIIFRKASTFGNANEVGAAVVPVTVKGSASQTANLTEWQSSAGSVLARVTSGGNLVTGGTLTATTVDTSVVSASTVTAVTSITSPEITASEITAGNFVVTPSVQDATNTSFMTLGSSGDITIGGTSLTVVPDTTCQGVLTASQGVIGDTLNVAGLITTPTIYDATVNYGFSLGSTITSFSDEFVVGSKMTLNGTITPFSTDNASAANNSIYYSTDANKLVYKDAAGVVNNLY